MKKQNHLIAGALVLTLAGLFSRLAGFFYRIFLSHQLGAEGMGLYQLVFPVYGVCTSLCCQSIQTALSRFIASESHRDKRQNRRTYFGCALFVSLSLALVSALLLYLFADPISAAVLGDERCASLLRMMALAVPVCAAHSCIVGYYYGLQKTNIPALSQIFEQAIRMGSVFLIYQAVTGTQTEFRVIHAIYGMVIGELAALVFCLIFFGPLMARENARGLDSDSFTACMGRLLRLAIPMTANRLVISLLQSGEAILIPGRLRLYGMSQGDALTLFGTLSGMALPFILFPSTMIHSLSVMLLPEVAKAQASNNQERIRRTSDVTIRLSLLVGILCLGVFRYFGEALGVVVFSSETAGGFIAQMSFLCPFLYLSFTLGSIINGLGRTEITFLHSLISLGIRLGTVYFAMPFLGISAYFYGLLASELVMVGLHLRYLCRRSLLRLNLYETVLKPTVILAAVCLTTGALQVWLDTKNSLPEIMGYLLAGAWFVCSFLGLNLLWMDSSAD